MPPPQFVSAGTFYDPGGTGTSHVVPAPASVGSLDIVLVHMYIEDTTAVTPPGGFSEIPTAVFTSAPATGGRVFWARGPGGSTYTFTTGVAVFRQATATRWTGCITTGDPYDPDTDAAQRSSNGTTTPAVSLTTSGSDRTVVWSGTAVSTGTWTPPSSYTERVDGTELSVASREQAVAGSTGSVTGTHSASSFQTAFLLALVPIPGYVPSIMSQYNSYH